MIRIDRMTLVTAITLILFFAADWWVSGFWEAVVILVLSALITLAIMLALIALGEDGK